jgi:alcohol dehydrogenase class IV
MEHFDIIMKELLNIWGIASADKSAEQLQLFLQEINIESDLAKVGADTEEKRKFLSKQVNMQRMSNNPVSLKPEKINHIFQLTH